MLGSCKKELSPTQLAETIAPFKQNQKEGEAQQGTIILGERLNNPYLVRNMETAFSTLSGTAGFNCSQIQVRPTHYYVKFKPQNLDQYEVLDADSNLNLSEYPLDYKIVQEGNFYHDPTLPDSAVTYQYAAVRMSYHFSDTIPYEIIEQLYIPEEDEQLVNDDNDDDSNPNLDCIDKLLDQAYIQTNNFSDTLSRTSNVGQRGRRPRFRPAGNVKIFDTRLQANIGFEGVSIRARRWFTTFNSRPNFNGDYRMSRTFTRSCNYSLWLATKRYAVRRHVVNTTYWINGPKQTGDWNYTIADGYSRFVGHVFRGAYRYAYQDIDGLKRPFRPLGERQVYIAVDDALSFQGVNSLLFPIRISRYQSGESEFLSDEIFSTTCHETAHTSHALRMNSLIQFAQVTAQLRESWAIAIEWRLSHLEYAGRGITNYGEADYNPIPAPNYPNHFAFQYWDGLNYSADYSSLYINLVDNFNELGYQFIGFPNGIINDHVTGYTLSYIESTFLKHVYGLSSLRENLKSNKPVGISDGQIDNLLDLY